MINIKLYFNDGHIEDSVYTKSIDLDCIGICTKSGVYILKKELYDELKYYPITKIGKCIYGFYKYNQEICDWLVDNNIKKIEIIKNVENVKK